LRTPAGGALAALDVGALAEVLDPESADTGVRRTALGAVDAALSTPVTAVISLSLMPSCRILPCTAGNGTPAFNIRWYLTSFGLVVAVVEDGVGRGASVGTMVGTLVDSFVGAAVLPAVLPAVLLAVLPVTAIISLSLMPSCRILPCTAGNGTPAFNMRWYLTRFGLGVFAATSTGGAGAWRAWRRGLGAGGVSSFSSEDENSFSDKNSFSSSDDDSTLSNCVSDVVVVFLDVFLDAAG